MHRLVTVCFSTVRALTLASAWGGHLGISEWGAQVGGITQQWLRCAPSRASLCNALRCCAAKLAGAAWSGGTCMDCRVLLALCPGTSGGELP